RNENRSRIAAWICNDVCAPDLIAIQLSQSVGNVLETLEPCVASRTQIGGQIDNLCACIMRTLHPFERSAMRKCGENQAGLPERCIFRRDERDLISGYARALPPLSVGGCKTKLETGVTGDKRDELAARVAAGAKDADRKFMHK